ncbi:unnamed protein product [Trichobilharzia regenti]|nr:unnamed protein product [Trichobilharzia regenti]
MPSPTSSRHQSVDYITKRFKTFTNMSDSFQNNDDNDSKPPNKSNTLNVSDQLNTGKKPIKSIDFHSERNDNRRDKIHRNELSKKSTVEKNDKLSEEELPVVEPTLIRSLTTGHNQRYTVDTSYSIEKEANIFPVACPVLLRLWLDEIKKDKYFKYLKKTEQIINKIPLESSCCLDNDSKLLTKAFMEVLYTPSKFGDSLLSNLAKISSKGCRCSRQIPPDITDLEFELFLSKLLPSYQAAVIMVYDSRLLDAMTVGTCSLLRQLYIRQQYTIPTLQHIFPGKSHTQSARANIPKRLYSGWKVTGTGACASVSTKAADYRFMCYNLAQNMNINEEEISYHGEQPLLLRRYYERPRPGDCLIFIKEKLCFIGSSFTGYEELPWTKEQLDRKVIECRNQLISHGFFLPPNFHLV